MKKVFLKKIGYVSIIYFCLAHEPQGIFAVFFRCLVQGATEDFCSVLIYSWGGFEKNRGLRGCFLLPVGEKGVSLKILFCSYIFLRAGPTWHSCSVL